MRLVFMGTPGFSATILEHLAQHHQISAVFTRPDAIRSRGKQLIPSPVKQVAVDAGIPVHTPTSLSDDTTGALVESLAPECICVAAYGALLPKHILDIPVYGCLNVHASILPSWRGAAPVERAILAGDDKTGVSIMRMEEGLDTGPFAIVRTTQIGNKNCTELTLELAELGASALLATLAQIEQGTVEWTQQDDFFATYAGKVGKREFFLSPSDDARTAMLKVQASSPAHPAKCSLAGRGATILETARVASRIERSVLDLEPGWATVHAKRLYLGFADQPLEVLQVKPDGKRAMKGTEMAAGLQGYSELYWSALDV